MTGGLIALVLNCRFHCLNIRVYFLNNTRAFPYDVVMYSGSVGNIKKFSDSDVIDICLLCISERVQYG